MFGNVLVSAKEISNRSLLLRQLENDVFNCCLTARNITELWVKPASVSQLVVENWNEDQLCYWEFLCYKGAEKMNDNEKEESQVSEFSSILKRYKFLNIHRWKRIIWLIPLHDFLWNVWKRVSLWASLFTVWATGRICERLIKEIDNYVALNELRQSVMKPFKAEILKQCSRGLMMSTVSILPQNSQDLRQFSLQVHYQKQ